MAGQMASPSLPRRNNVRFGSLADIGEACQECPLYPQKRTFVSPIEQSALCHKQTFTQARPPISRPAYRRFQGKVCCPVAIAHQESTIVLSVRCSPHLPRVGDQSRSLRQDYRAKEQRRRSPQADQVAQSAALSGCLSWCLVP